MVRLAGEMDRRVLLDMGKRFIASTSYHATTPVRAERLNEVVTALLHQGGCWVLEHDEWVVGMLGVLIAPVPLTGEPCAMEVMWWVEPDYRGRGGALQMWHAAEAWAEAHGATAMQMLQPVDNAGLATLYGRRGYVPIETVWYRRFADGGLHGTA